MVINLEDFRILFASEVAFDTFKVALKDTAKNELTLIDLKDDLVIIASPKFGSGTLSRCFLIVKEKMRLPQWRGVALPSLETGVYCCKLTCAIY